MLSKEELAEIRAITDAATEGPWEERKHSRKYQDYAKENVYEIEVVANRRPGISSTPVCRLAFPYSMHNSAPFIAKARQVIPALLAHIEELEGVITSMRLDQQPALSRFNTHDPYRYKSGERESGYF